MIPPITIRASSTPMYTDCSRRTMARMVPNQVADWGYKINDILPHIGAVVGTASHAGAAQLLTEKMATGEVRVTDETKDRVEEAFKKEAEHGVEWDEITPRTDVGLSQAGRIVATYARTVAAKVTPIAVEQQLSLTTIKGNTVQGRVDLTTEAVRDLKTGKFQNANIAQYGTYSLLIRGNGGSVAYVAEDYFKRVAMKDMQPAPVETIYDVKVAEAAAGAIIRRIERDYEAFMESGDPAEFTANPNSILCSPKFCRAWGTDFCKEHRR